MTEATGSSRTSTVLDPEFVKDLPELPTEEVRRRRDAALAERDYQSYLRRLIQVRQDILGAERDRRRRGGEPPQLLDRLATVLAGGPRPKSRGEALRLNLSETDLEEAERRADAVLGTSSVRPEDLDDAQLEEALDALEREEHAVSVDRAAVIQAHDTLQDELKRRYREDPSQIPQQL